MVKCARIQICSSAKLRDNKLGYIAGNFVRSNGMEVSVTTRKGDAEALLYVKFNSRTGIESHRQADPPRPAAGYASIVESIMLKIINSESAA